MFNFHQENADFLSQVIEQIKKGYYFKRWVVRCKLQIKPRIKKRIETTYRPEYERNWRLEAALGRMKVQSDLNEQDMADMQSMVRYSKKQDEQNQSLIQKPINLKYGDLIYLKFYVGPRKSGIISGDGIASNKLECIPQDKITNDEIKIFYELEDQKGKEVKSILKKNAKLMFRKCLFQVTNAQKYYYCDLLKNAQQLEAPKEVIDDLTKKKEEEEEDNITTFKRVRNINIVYGQEVQFKHIYSGCILRLNQDVLAYESCCREISLEEQSNDWSNFTIVSVNNSKKIGEPITYSDQIQIVSTKNKRYCLNIQKGNIKDLQKGLEVNAYENPANLKLCSFMEFTSYNERSDILFKQAFLSSGDIVLLLNRTTASKISVSRKIDITKHIKERNVKFEMDDQKLVTMTQQYFDVKEAKSNLIDQFYVHLESYLQNSSDEDNINVLWEIQKVDSFNSALPRFSDAYRFKHVCSGLYLCLRKGKLDLIYDGLSEDCIFYLNPKKSILQKNESLHMGEVIKIQAIDIGEVMLLYCLELEDRQFLAEELQIKLSNINDLAFIPKSRLDKKKRNRADFEIAPANQELRYIADRVSSLFPYLFDFYLFLQEWGIQMETTYVYRYNLAFNNQKLLYNHVQELYQSLENLEDFLQFKDNESQLKMRQKILLDNGILNMLIYILKLIHFMIYGFDKNAKQEGAEQFLTYVSNQQAIPDRSAQKIAQLKLKPAIAALYKILIMSIKGNSDCASYIFSVENGYLDFFLDQLKYYKEIVQEFLKEAVTYMNSEDEKEEDNLKKWIYKLDSINEDNLENQTFMIDLLGLSINDSLEQPLPPLQNIVRRHLFNKRIKKDPNSCCTLDYCLLRFGVHQGDIPIVYFNTKYSQTEFRETFNFTLCNLNKKAREKKQYYVFNEEDEKYFNAFDLRFIIGKNEQLLSKRNTGLLAKYEQYIISVLMLYAALCSGRNTKIKVLMEDRLNLKKEFINCCIRYFAPLAQKPQANSQGPKESQMQYYKCFLKLYETIILDVEPLIRISQYNNKCHVIKDIQQFTCATQKSYKLFRDISIETQKNPKMQQLFARLKGEEGASDFAQHELIKKIADYVVSQEDQKTNENGEAIGAMPHSQELMELFIRQPESRQLANQIPNQFNMGFHKDIFAQIKGDNKNVHEIPNEILAEQLLEVFLSMLKIIRNRIDLGYNTLDQNRRILQTIPNILFAIIYQNQADNKNIFLQSDQSIKQISASDANKPDQQQQQQQPPSNNSSSQMQSQAQTPQTGNNQQQQQQQQNEEEDDKNISTLEYIKKFQYLNWVFSFLLYMMNQKVQNQLLFTKIFIESIAILDTLSKLKLELLNVNQIKKQIAKQEKAEGKDEQKSQGGFLSFFGGEEQDKEFEDIQRSMDLYDERSSQISLTSMIYTALSQCEKNYQLKKQMMQSLIKQFTFLEDLDEGIKCIEIIDDEYELSLFRHVNGTSEQSDIKSPKEIDYMATKTIQYIRFKQIENSLNDINKVYSQQDEQEALDDEEITKIVQKRQALHKYFVQFSQTIDQMIDLFKLPDFDKYDPPKPREEYIKQLQNIMRNAGIHKIILRLFENIRPNQSYFLLDFYRKIIIFFELYTQNNEQSKQDLINNLEQILDMAIIPYFTEDEERQRLLMSQQIGGAESPNGGSQRKLKKNALNKKPVSTKEIEIQQQQNNQVENADLLSMQEQQQQQQQSKNQQDEIINLGDSPSNNNQARTTSQRIIATSIERKQPLRIVNLVIQLLENVKLNQEKIYPIIDMLFRKLVLNNPIQFVTSTGIVSSGFGSKQFGRLEINPLLGQAVLQLLKIIRNLAQVSNSQQIRQNQKRILNNILKEDFVLRMLEPVTIQYLQNFGQRFRTSENEYMRLKLHVSTMQLMINTVKNNRLGIQEMQRQLMFESLKNIVLFHEAPFLMKRVYIRALFELYVNRVIDFSTGDCNETISEAEVSEILSRECIPKIDTKTIYGYLEGLVRAKPMKEKGGGGSAANAQQSLDVVWDTRRQMIKEKVAFFEKYKEFKYLASKDRILVEANQDFQSRIYQGVVRDPQEYWKYIMKEGVMHFLTDTYDELQDYIENDQIKDNQLADEFSIAKTMIQRLHQLFEVMDKDFRVRKEDLFMEEFKVIVLKAEELIPKRSIRKFGMNFRITPQLQDHQQLALLQQQQLMSSGQTTHINSSVTATTSALGKAGINIEKYDTLQEDIFGQNEDQDQQQKKQQQQQQESKVKIIMKKYCMRNRIGVEGLVQMLIVGAQQKDSKSLARVFYNIVNKDKVYLLPHEVQNFLQSECRLPAEATYRTIKNKQQKNKKAIKQDESENNIDPSFLNKVVDVVKSFFTVQKKADPLNDIAGEIQQQQDDQNKKSELQGFKSKQSHASGQKSEVNMDAVKLEFKRQITNLATQDLKAIQRLLAWLRDGMTEEQIEKLKQVHHKEELKQQKKMLDKLKQQEQQSDQIGDQTALAIKQHFVAAVQQDKQSMQDVQLIIMLHDFVALQGILKSKQALSTFIERAKITFANNKIYLIKTMRILLETLTPSELDMELIRSDNKKDQENAQLKFEDFQQYQNACVEQDLHTTALRFLRENAPFQIQIESLSLLIALLTLGNKNCQYKILKLLQSHDRKLCSQFFSYLRNFFQSNMEQEIIQMKQLRAESEQASAGPYAGGLGIQSSMTQYEQLSMKILKMIALFCENVNRTFQKFLRQQSNNESLLANTNVVLEISNFLAFFLEDSQLHTKDKDHLIVQSLDTLTEVCTGQPQNQQIVCNNKRLFSFINEKIIMRKRTFQQFIQTDADLQKNEEDIEQDINMFSSAVNFILTMVIGSTKEAALAILDQLNVKKLISIIKDIYIQRIQPKENRIIMERLCFHEKENERLGRTKYKCTPTYCQKGLVTLQDKKLTDAGFNIFMIFYYLHEICSDNERLELFNSEEFIKEMNEKKLLKQKRESHQTQKKRQQFVKVNPLSGGGGIDKTDNQTQQQNKPRLSKLINEENLALYNQKQDTNNLLKSDPKSFIKIIKQKLAEMDGEQIILHTSPDQEDDNIAKKQENNTDQNEEFKKDENFFKFYKQYLGRVEVVHMKEGTLHQVFFRKPFISTFMNDFIKYHLIYEADRDSDQERLQFLMDQYEFYKEQMIHKQHISRFTLISLFANNWRVLKDISFYIVLGISLMEIITYDDRQQPPVTLWWVSSIEEICTIIQLVIACIVIVCCAIERYPISINKCISDTNMRKIQRLKVNAGFQLNYIQAKYQIIMQWILEIIDPEAVKKSFWKQFFMMSIDFENIYNVLYLIVTLFAFQNSFVYAYLLLDIIKRSEDLQNIIKSITQNLRNLAKFAFFGLVLLYNFGILGFLYFKDFYDPELGAYSGSFALTIASTVMGLPVGIYKLMSFAPYHTDGESNSLFWGRYFFDLFYFIIIITLFNQIVQGIILDTFGELRQDRTEVLQDVECKCYICGKDRTEIDQETKDGWYNHIYLVHNVYHMLFFMIYVTTKQEHECNSIEKFCRKSLLEKNISFFPIGKIIELELKEKEKSSN